MNLPKFNVCCGTDDYRPRLQYVYVNTDYITATNASIMAWQKSSIIDEEFLSFVESHRGIFIHHSEWKKIAGKEAEFIEAGLYSIIFTVKGNRVLVDYRTKSDFEISIGKYPDWKSVLPVDLNKEEPILATIDLSAIGFDPNQLAKLCRALGIVVGARLDFFGNNKPILVTKEEDPKGAVKEHWSSRGGIIMPVSLEKMFHWL